MAKMKALGDRISEGEEELRSIEGQVERAAMRIPTLPYSYVPIGASAEASMMRAKGSGVVDTPSLGAIAVEGVVCGGGEGGYWPWPILKESS